MMETVLSRGPLQMEGEGHLGSPHTGKQARRDGGLVVWAEFLALVRLSTEDAAGEPLLAGARVQLYRPLSAAIAERPIPSVRAPLAGRMDERELRRLLDQVARDRLNTGDDVDGPSSRGMSLRDGLTERELDVLRLIAAGKSNQQIASTLMISPNTVARHVSNIFVKTGAANRAEAAAYAVLHDLLRSA